MLFKMLKLFLASSLLFVFADAACDMPNSFETGRNSILSAHNYYRSVTSNGTRKYPPLPPATNIRKLEWSCDLQKSAQKVADSLTDCILPPYSSTGGENAWVSRSNIYNPNINIHLEAAIILAEWMQLDSDLKELVPNKDNYPVTQILWWNTDKVGCAYAQCRDRMVKQAYVTVCHYSPVGNIPGQQVYEAGKTCSNCGSGYKCGEANLCVPV